MSAKLEKIAAERDEWDSKMKEWDRKYREQENEEIQTMVHAANLPVLQRIRIRRMLMKRMRRISNRKFSPRFWRF